MSFGLADECGHVQGTFLRSLAQDYERWATSSYYREQRREHALQSDRQVIKQV